MLSKHQFPIIIISGPAGVGKTTVAKALQRAHPELETSVTYTTRPPRSKTPEDKKIYYINTTQFETMIARGEFLEWAKVHDQYYGTHKVKTLKKIHRHPVIFNVDVQGAKQIMQQLSAYPIVSIFLLPESIAQIRDRIIQRGHCDPDDLNKRLTSAERELKARTIYQYQIINNEGKIQETIARIEQIITPYFLKKKPSIFSQIRTFLKL